MKKRRRNPDKRPRRRTDRVLVSEPVLLVLHPAAHTPITNICSPAASGNATIWPMVIAA